jgi:glucosamine-6-phosphate deaminase
MVITIFDTLEHAAMVVADEICDAIAAKPTAVLGLAAGRTPVPLYRELAARHAAGTADFSRVTTFNLDEFVGITPGAPGSFRRFMDERFFSGVNVASSSINFLDGMAPDTTAECLRYETAIGEAGGIDLQLLGIGANGHVGFNEPAEELTATTHHTALLPPTRLANAALFGGDVARVPESALTMGIGTILSAREVILMAAGERKARCIAQLVEGGLTTRMPASLLQLHPRVRVFLDRSAAALLS